MIYHVWTSWFGCIWICLDILVSFCKMISISFVLRICADLRTLVLNAIGCIYHVFKYIRNVYDSVKFLSDVMSFISALGCSSSLWPVWPVRGDQSDRSRRVLAGVDRSDRSQGPVWPVCGSGTALVFACVRYMIYCITDLFMMITHTCYTPRMLRFRGSLICARYV